MHLLELGWLGGVKRSVGTQRVSGDTADRGKLLVVVRPIPIARPLPDVSGHVVQAVRIRRVMRHGRCSDETVLAGVGVWEVALVCVRHPFPVWSKFVAPDT